MKLPFDALCLAFLLTHNAVGQYPHPLPARSPLVDSALALVSARLGPVAARATIHPEWTQFQSAEPRCADLPAGSTCSGLWHYSWYLLLFDFAPIPARGPHGLIAVALDSLGSAIPGTMPVGAPDCAASPEECYFPITLDSARALGASLGVPGDPAEWQFSFRWGTEFPWGTCWPCDGHFADAGHWRTFVWQVEAPTERSSSGLPIVARVVWLDARTGDVLGQAIRTTSH